MIRIVVHCFPPHYYATECRVTCFALISLCCCGVVEVALQWPEICCIIWNPQWNGWKGFRTASVCHGFGFQNSYNVVELNYRYLVGLCLLQLALVRMMLGFA
uniref:RBX1 n=1 Tax=Arundo donax TaxID=35708 RepID=A0A0A9CBY9_ARUDO